MNCPTLSGSPIHYVPWTSFFGVMQGIPGYLSGDRVDYGGALYTPTGVLSGGSTGMIFSDLSGRDHEARMHDWSGKPLFYCS